MKIVIIVLVLVAVIFIIFVLTGAFSSESQSNSNQQARDFTKNPPAWTKTIKSFIGSRQPKIDNLKPSYGAGTVRIPKDEDNPIRTATFRLASGSASVRYKDETEDAGDLQDQQCPLPNFDNKDDIRQCSIVALKRGGTLTITCIGQGTCQVDVVK